MHRTELSLLIFCTPPSVISRGFLSTSSSLEGSSGRFPPPSFTLSDLVGGRRPQHFTNEDKERKPNLGYLFAKRVEAVKSSGSIIFGGLGTWLAFKLGFQAELLAMEPLEKKARLDADRLIAAHHLAKANKQGKSFVWKVKEVSWCYLPCTFVTPLRLVLRINGQSPYATCTPVI